ncbi:MAG: 16S rRNA (cytidine(1402)-2'-O)-methyltransferase [Gemmatimonadetes bacterium]|nr:16S rRNA (cytidine(1402)-2'-O)-methyltransferase [Gemmatimonadota bacterium]
MATLYLVSTPIGHLGDLSPRAADTLRSVDRILAEDTRRTRILANHAEARAPLVSLHAHNERARIARILGWLEAGESLALVSDAGTPLVSDPGGRVVAAVAEGGYDIVPIPGPSAVLAALISSGLPTDRFVFLGFPERKGKGRRALLERVASSEETVVLFESPRRLVALLEALVEACGPERRVSVARELTKIYEEIRRGTLVEVAAYYRERPPKGEVTLVVAAGEQDALAADREAEAVSLAEELIGEGMKPSAAARELTNRLRVARNDAYRIVHDLEGHATDE